LKPVSIINIGIHLGMLAYSVISARLNLTSRTCGLCKTLAHS